MKAIQYTRFGGRDVLQYLDLPEPTVQLDEVLIDVTASGVNFVDIRERQGVYQRADTHVGADKVLPRVSGLQAVGRVRSVGPTGDTTLIGKKVVTVVNGGGYAQVTVAPAYATVVVPEDADDFKLAALPTQWLTAWLMLNSSTQLQAGESILIHGAAGGVGSIATQLAKAMGGNPIVGSASTPEKRSFILGLGADAAVDYTAEDWPSQVLTLTKGKGADVILESIGGTVFEQNFTCLATFGRHIIFGSTREPGKPLPPRQLMSKCQAMIGIYLPVFFGRPDLIRKGMEEMVDRFMAATIQPHVSKILPLREVAEAHRLLEERLVTGALVLNPSDGS
jgi:NADPH2:quinone reductase